MKKQQGQVVLILILVMTVALAIGISVVQRSLSDISTATKVEQSQRAFSAAEAGIEQALNNGNLTPVEFPEIQSKATVEGGSLIPVVPATGVRQEALEFPPLSREQTAHVWLANFDSTSNPPERYYNPPGRTLDVYWGYSPSDKAALELTLIYYEDEQYKTTKWFLDPAERNGFDPVSCSNNQCRKTLDTPYDHMVMITARLLLNSTSQIVGFQAEGPCNQGCSLPPQAKTFVSTGTAGQTQRKIKLFQIEKVAPPYFDYGLFSISEINK